MCLRQGLKNREISDIWRQRNDNRHRLSIDGKIDKIADISAKNGEWRHVPRSQRRSPKNQRFHPYIADFKKNWRFFAEKIAINRRFFCNFKEFDLTAKFEFLRIWWPKFHLCMCKGFQRSDLWSNGGKSIFTLYKGYGVFPTVIWRSNGEIWTKFWSND